LAALDREFLEVRARLLEIGAALDRIDRAGGTPGDDPRLTAIARAIDALRSGDGDRAEQIQLIFSIPYLEDWRHALGVVAR
jgi:hypothetical protein